MLYSFIVDVTRLLLNLFSNILGPLSTILLILAGISWPMGTLKDFAKFELKQKFELILAIIQVGWRCRASQL
jgi:hypothetical protein